MSRYVPYLLIGVPFTLLIIFIFLPEIYSLYLSFNVYELGKEMYFVGLKNYVDVFGSSDFWFSLRITIIYILVGVGLEFLVGLGVALLIYGISKGQRVIMTIILLPYAISEVVAAVTWKSLLDPIFGLYNYFMTFLGVPMGSLLWFADMNLALPAIIVVNVWKSAPFTIVIIYSALVTLPNEPFEAARIDGASRWQTFRFLTVPLIAPACLIALMFRTIFLFRMFALPYNLTRGGPVNMTRLLAIYLYDTAFRYWQFGAAAAIAMIMLIITLVLSIIYLRDMYRRITL